MGVTRMGAIALVLGLAGLFTSLETPAQAPAVQNKSSVRPAPVSDVPRDLLRDRRPPVRPPKRGPEVFFCETFEPSCRTNADKFSLAELRDLYVFVVWPGIDGQHIQTMQFLLPDGSLYASKQTRFTIGGFFPQSTGTLRNDREVSSPAAAPHLMADANKHHSEGIPSLLTKSRGDSAVVTVLPVGGTYIAQRNLAGTWHVRIQLDDKAAVEAQFTLTSRPVPASAVAGSEE